MAAAAQKQNSLPMPMLRSATMSPVQAVTPSPTAAATPRGAKRRQTPRRAAKSPDSSQFTAPHMSPLAGAGHVGIPKMLSASPKSSRKRLYGDLVAPEKPKWNPRDPVQMQAVKEALHVATVPSCSLVYRDDEQRRVFEFCRRSQRASMYVAAPVQGRHCQLTKSRRACRVWADEMGMETPDDLSINCTNLGNTSDIFSKILGKFQVRKKASGKLSPLQQLQNMFSNKESAPSGCCWSLWMRWTAIFSGLASLGENVDRRIELLNQQAEGTYRMLERIGQEAAASLKELETHYYSSVVRTRLYD